MKLSMRRSHQRRVLVFNAWPDFRQRRGNGLLTTAGLLNGIFGEGPDLHVARWESIKVTDRFEETDENEVTTIRERERFTQSLTLVYADGTTSILDERSSEP